MSLISQRPRHWSSVVGQERPIRVLRAVLGNRNFMPTGFILDGMRGVGKSTTALIAARALLCTSEDPYGCGKCPSCLTADEMPDLANHPDFVMKDAASNSSVDKITEILTSLESLPVKGKCRVLLIDEAHHLSKEAWDVLRAPLDKNNSYTIFMFLSTEVEKIPIIIRSRCCPLRFSRLASEKIRGLLINRASDSNIPYEMDGIDLLVRHSKGIPREALMMLNSVAAVGPVTKQLVSDIIDNSLEEGCLKVWMATLTQKIEVAVKAMDELTLVYRPAKIVETMFAMFGDIMFGQEPVDAADQKAYTLVRQHYLDKAAVTSVLIKWSELGNLPADAMALFVLELFQIREGKVQQKYSSTVAAPARKVVDDPDAPLSEVEISRLLNAEKKTS